MPKPTCLHPGCQNDIVARVAAIGLDGRVRARIHCCRRHLNDAVTGHFGHPLHWREFALAVIPANIDITLDTDGQEVRL